MILPLGTVRTLRPTFRESRLIRGFPVAQLVKNLSVMQKTWVQSLGQEDPLEKEMATHPLQYSCLGNPMDRGAWWATVHGVSKSRT